MRGNAKRDRRLRKFCDQMRKFSLPWQRGGRSGQIFTTPLMTGNRQFDSRIWDVFLTQTELAYSHFSVQISKIFVTTSTEVDQERVWMRSLISRSRKCPVWYKHLRLCLSRVIANFVFKYPHICHRGNSDRSETSLNDTIKLAEPEDPETPLAQESRNYLLQKSSYSQYGYRWSQYVFGESGSVTSVLLLDQPSISFDAESRIASDHQWLRIFLLPAEIHSRYGIT